MILISNKIFHYVLAQWTANILWLQVPIKTGGEFINYKDFFSIVIITIVDANYSFMYVNVECQSFI